MSLHTTERRHGKGDAHAEFIGLATGCAGRDCVFVAAVAKLAACGAAGGDDGVDAAVKSYEKVSGVAGNLNSIGSDTLNNLMTYWAEAFSKLYPNVKIQVEGKGSATAPPALTGAPPSSARCRAR